MSKLSETTQPTKNVVNGKDFAKLTKKALKLGATSLDYSNRKNSNYFITLDDGKKYFSEILSTRGLFDSSC